jgi:hypothetical protein
MEIILFRSLKVSTSGIVGIPVGAIRATVVTMKDPPRLEMCDESFNGYA